MKTIYLKLAASVLSIVMALTMIVGATFAWFTFSTSPEVGGISIAIGGGRTIMLAPDVTETVEVDGKTMILHYPGTFSSNLEFSEYETYDYLKELSGLSPVSTADGMYWILPTYNELTGELNEISEFQVDDKLQNANLNENSGGHYIYVDFWIVSPSSEYTIRVSTDVKKKEGSYLVELPNNAEGENGTVDLTSSLGMTESCARVGFLVNTEEISEEEMKVYKSSDAYIKQYEKLQGVYPEKGEEISGTYRFAIYEPNATKHPAEKMSDGQYLVTNPLGYNLQDRMISEKDVSSYLMIQGQNTWRTTSMLSSDYQAGNIGAYVRSGDFYKLTSALYEHAADGVVNAEALNKIATAGATDDVMITKLTSNTPQKIRMYVWLEGQDADCTNTSSVEASTLALSLELSGANQ